METTVSRMRSLAQPSDILTDCIVTVHSHNPGDGPGGCASAAREGSAASGFAIISHLKGSRETATVLELEAAMGKQVCRMVAAKE
jgi:hypothetical protein